MRHANFLFDCTLIALVASGGCTTTRTQPSGAPSDSAAAASDKVRSGYTAADVQFMQGMIAHHAQALAMSALIEGRSNRAELKLMGQRIRLSQETEIAQMQNWLRKRGETVPSGTTHDHTAMGHGTLMPGMLTEAEITQLRNATGAGFDRLFLQLMIKHHEGAITMVRQLFATQGAAQDPELFLLANDIDADQNAELRRMRALLATM
jgi:uncharacterized protein (DUF305 family)